MKPSIPKGTRDFSPVEMVRRNYILDTIRTVYQRYGYLQIETPAMENLSTLEGKYGDEGDKLLFRILNSGLVLDEIRSREIGTKSEILNSDITEKGLRYDLTVPFARYVVMHQNDITFPFKRYQIQPVWRADRPQKGRYREFYQCDADVIGSESLLNEVEMIQMIDEVFSKLGIKVLIKLNNRKILYGIAEAINAVDKMEALAISMDKLEKIGYDEVKEDLKKKGFNDVQINKINEIVLWMHAGRMIFKDKIEFLKRNKEFGSSEIFQRGVKEVEDIFQTILDIQTKIYDIELDITLARGLNYYTGTIFEVKVNDPRSTFTSSVLGGGRYDDLTGIFGLPNVSGVGISFGVDRIYDVMEEMKLFDQLNLQSSSTQIMFINWNETEQFCLRKLQEVRTIGVNAEIYPEETKKIGKQFSYADDKNIPFVISIGPSEKEKQAFRIKNMSLTKENEFSLSEFENIIQKIKNKEEF